MVFALANATCHVRADLLYAEGTPLLTIQWAGIIRLHAYMTHSRRCGGPLWGQAGFAKA